MQQLILSVNSESAKPLKHYLDDNVHAKLFPLVFGHWDQSASMTFCPWALIDSGVLCRCSMYSWRRPRCVGTHTCGIIKKKNPTVFLESEFLSLSTIHFPMTWWHSGDANSRTYLLLFMVGFNPLIGSFRFLRVRTFLTRKFWKMGGGKYYIPNPSHLWHWNENLFMESIWT